MPSPALQLKFARLLSCPRVESGSRDYPHNGVQYEFLYRYSIYQIFSTTTVQIVLLQYFCNGRNNIFHCILLFIIDERVGQLCCILSSTEVADTVRSQLKLLVRRLWSNPPNHGARIVATALCNPTLYQEWCVVCVDRITILQFIQD